jgi:tRNA pseudouridine38-40 synthase
MERAFLLVLTFDGTDFCGWQRQSEGRSVQQVVEETLSLLAASPRRAVAAGRTDAGVHATALPVSTTMPDRWSAGELLRALNATLPGDLAVREVRAVRPGTDARRAARGRRYSYDVGVDGTSRSPFRSRTEWPLGRALAVPAMDEAANRLPGEHDFRAFAAVGEPKPHYCCRISEARWRPLDDARLQFVIAADRFLHHMVRMLVGTMVDIGLERRPAADMNALLHAATNADTSPPAPAAGLRFVAAEYPEEIFLEDRATW